LTNLHSFPTRRSSDLGAEPHPVSPSALTTGAVSSAIRHWLSDHDVCGIQTNWRRRLLFTLRWKLQNTLIQRWASDPDAFQYNYRDRKSTRLNSSHVSI